MTKEERAAKRLERTRNSKREAYREKLLDPRWQKKRLAVLNRDDWACQKCGDKEPTLHVHHAYYIPGREPWDYEGNAFVTLCEHCHKEESEQRYENENLLLHALRSMRLYHEDIHELAYGFHMIENVQIEGVLIHALSWMLRDRQEMGNLVGRFFDYIKVKQPGLMRYLDEREGLQSCDLMDE